MRNLSGRLVASLVTLATIARDPPCAAQTPAAALAPACPDRQPLPDGEWTDGTPPVAITLRGSTVAVTMTGWWYIPGPLVLEGSGCLYVGRFTTRRTVQVDPTHRLQEQVYEGEARLTIASPDTLELEVRARSRPAGRAWRRVDVTRIHVRATLHRH
jgi:hypothetical protein